MYRNVTAWLIVLALVPTAIREAVAQERLDLSGVEVNVHGGVAFLDELETNEPFAGGTALIHVGSGVALGGTVDWVPATVDLDENDDEDGESAALWYYSAELQYGFPSVTQAQFYGLIGAGVAKFQPSEDLEDLGVEDESDIMVPVGVGVRWYNDKEDASWGATLEVRDRIVYKDEEETKVSNDWSLGIGLSLVLGG
ncbi:MAG TPA: outer membrane beta-barrel protein [Gemmatimonadota bacterium]|nr:outer membrane beta-barrel protein [Gemmatimonadota bacterium]